MGGQGVAGHQPVHESVIDQLAECLTRIVIEDDGRAQNPQDEPVLAFVSEKIVEFVVIDGKRSLAGQMRAEGELLLDVRWKVEGFGVDVNTVFAVFPSAAGDLVPGFEVPEFGHLQPVVFRANHDAVHARLFQKAPFCSAQVEVFRIDRGGMIIIWRHAGVATGLKTTVGELLKGSRSGDL